MSKRQCKHENADHWEVRLNGNRFTEWMVCLDCEARLDPKTGQKAKP